MPENNKSANVPEIGTKQSAEDDRKTAVKSSEGAESALDDGVSRALEQYVAEQAAHEQRLEARAHIEDKIEMEFVELDPVARAEAVQTADEFVQNYERAAPAVRRGIDQLCAASHAFRRGSRRSIR